jgi:hypothetical protein
MWDAAGLSAGTSTEIWIASAETWILRAAYPAMDCPRPCPGSVKTAATPRGGHTRARSLSSAAQAEQSRRRMPSRKVRTSQGGWSVTPTRGNPRESATEKTPPKPGAAAAPQAGKGEMVR